MADLVECSCCGRNPHCVICNGFGMVRPSDKEKIRLPKLKVKKSGTKKRQKIIEPQHNIDSILEEPTKHSKRKNRRAIISSKSVSASHPIQKPASKVPDKEPFRSVQTKSLKKHIRVFHPGQLPSLADSDSISLNKAGKSKKTLNQCPYCISKAHDLHKHVKKVHPDKLEAFQKKNRLRESQKKITVSRPTKNTIKRSNPLSHSSTPLRQPLLDISVETNKEILQKLGFLICEKCGVKVREDKYKDHYLRRHSQTNKKLNQREKKPSRGIVIMVEPDRSKKNTKKTPQVIDKTTPTKKARTGGPKLIYLEDKWGVKVNDLKTCSCCRERAKPVWHFKLSNCGEVYICAKCKPQVFKDSFEKKDALDHAVQGGMFEGNRSRH